MMAMLGRWNSPLRAALVAWAALWVSPAQAVDPVCQTAMMERERAGLGWEYRIVAGAPGYASGTDMAAGDRLDVPAGAVVQLCDSHGDLLTVRGPVAHQLSSVQSRLDERRQQQLAAARAAEAERAAQASAASADRARAAAQAEEAAKARSTRGFAIAKPAAKPAAPAAAAPAAASPSPAARARTGAVRGGSSPAPVPRAAARPSIPAYPVWPPETPSSRASLDRFITKRSGMSLYDAGQKLIGSFEDAGYLEHSFYSAPGGFVLVTRIEKIGEDGRALDGAERYRLPNQRSDPSMTDYIRNLFLEAPPGFYRYIAIVVSNEPYRTSGKRLADAEAIKRLRQGSNDLDRSYRDTAFSADYNVDALIYEFRKDAKNGQARMIDPGRLPPNTHLARTRLDSAIRKRFAP